MIQRLRRLIAVMIALVVWVLTLGKVDADTTGRTAATHDSEGERPTTARHVDDSRPTAKQLASKTEGTERAAHE